MSKIGSGFCPKCEIIYDPEATNFNMGKCPICRRKLIINVSGKFHAPKCPTCKSRDIEKITQGKRLFSAFLFGIATPTAKAQFICNNCGYKW